MNNYYNMVKKSTSTKQRAKNLGITEAEYKGLSEQVENEINTSSAFMSPRFPVLRKRVKLHNNQKKKPSSIGDPMIFTQFQILLAALYDDKLIVDFSPRTKSDEHRADNLNPLYEHDAVDMKKEIIDYMLMWNTLFFGRGLCIMSQWDPKLLIPKPEVVNMLTWYRDPNATSVNGDSEGRGAMRFGGRPIANTLAGFKNNNVYKNLDQLDTSENSDLEDAQQAIDEAHGFSSMGDVSGDNKNYTIVEWFTKFTFKDKNGDKKQKRILVGYQEGLLVRMTVLKDQEEWPIVDKTIYPDAMSWDGVSVLDILEDKQRASAKLINAALFNVDSNTYQMQLYDAKKITNPSNLKYGRNKRIPVNGNPDGAVVPVQTQQIGQEIGFMLDKIQGMGQGATGAPEFASGPVKTATEVATVAEGADTRFSLAAKIFGWSEKEFARYWYKMYKMYYTKAIDEKVLKVNGLIGYHWRKLKKDDIVGEADPNIKVKSKIVSEARRLRELQSFTNSYPILAADPNTNKEYLTRRWAKLNGYNSVEMQILFKDDPDRMVAKLENAEFLKTGDMPKISPQDEDWKHIDEHAKEDGMEKHIEAHRMQILVKAKNPKVKDEVAELTQSQQPQIQPQDIPQPQNFDTPKTLNVA